MFVTPRRLVVIDDDLNGGFLLVRSLFRRFPRAVVQLCRGTKAVRDVLGMEAIDAIVVHRAHQRDAVSLIRRIREVKPTVAIISVSSSDRSKQVLAAGATAYVDYRHWLLLGDAVAKSLIHREPKARLIANTASTELRTSSRSSKGSRFVPATAAAPLGIGISIDRSRRSRGHA
jgi:hypothetical protein